MGERKNAPGRRFNELDGLRGLAAFAVFLGHARYMLNLKTPFFSSIEHGVLPIFWDGAASVVLFFVLSGFVLALPYVGENAKPLDIVPFLVRRIFRIYPAYLAAIAAALFLKAFLFRPGGLGGLSDWFSGFWSWDLHTLSLRTVFLHILMIGPWFDPGTIDPIIWSLVVEMKISLLFPVVILVLRCIKSFAGALAVLGLSFVLAATLEIQYLNYLPLFVLGGLMACFHRTLVDTLQKAPAFEKLLLIGAGILLYTAGYSLQGFTVEESFKNYVIGAGAAVIILYALAIPRFSAFLSRGSAKFLGNISYSFYLLHFPILLTCSSIIFSRRHPAVTVAGSWLAGLTVSFLLSYASYRWIELPFQKLGRSVARKLDFKLPGNYKSASLDR